MLGDKFKSALVLAAELHQKQVRKASSIPYVAHLLAVTAIVLEHGGSETEAIAALLHDAIEDQGGAATRERIRREFGEAVCEIVNGCTDSDTMPRPPWRERKLAHIEKVRVAGSSVRLVVAADKLHNVRSMLIDHRTFGDSLWERFSGGQVGTLWYYREMLSALAGHADHAALLVELARSVCDLEALNAVRK
jgi:GTP pyrophosphokinase